MFKCHSLIFSFFSFIVIIYFGNFFIHSNNSDCIKSAEICVHIKCLHNCFLVYKQTIMLLYKFLVFLHFFSSFCFSPLTFLKWNSWCACVIDRSKVVFFIDGLVCSSSYKLFYILFFVQIVSWFILHFFNGLGLGFNVRVCYCSCCINGCFCRGVFLFMMQTVECFCFFLASVNFIFLFYIPIFLWFRV